MESRLEKAIKKLTELGLIDSFIENKLEQAYIEQLKKEAHERFREIKEGDRFDRSPIWPHWEKRFKMGLTHKSYEGWTYQKTDDTFYFNGYALYQQGKWATRVKERVKVNAIDLDIEVSSSGPYLIKPEFSIKNVGKYDKLELMGFLSSQLEKYLNGEIE